MCKSGNQVPAAAPAPLTLPFPQGPVSPPPPTETPAAVRSSCHTASPSLPKGVPGRGRALGTPSPPSPGTSPHPRHGPCGRSSPLRPEEGGGCARRERGEARNERGTSSVSHNPQPVGGQPTRFPPPEGRAGTSGGGGGSSAFCPFPLRRCSFPAPDRPGEDARSPRRPPPPRGSAGGDGEGRRGGTGNRGAPRGRRRRRCLGC